MTIGTKGRTRDRDARTRRDRCLRIGEGRARWSACRAFLRRRDPSRARSEASPLRSFVVPFRKGSLDERRKRNPRRSDPAAGSIPPRSFPRRGRRFPFPRARAFGKHERETERNESAFDLSLAFVFPSNRSRCFEIEDPLDARGSRRKVSSLEIERCESSDRPVRRRRSKGSRGRAWSLATNREARAGVVNGSRFRRERNGSDRKSSSSDGHVEDPTSTAIAETCQTRHRPLWFRRRGCAHAKNEDTTRIRACSQSLCLNDSWMKRATTYFRPIHDAVCADSDRFHARTSTMSAFSFPYTRVSHEHFFRTRWNLRFDLLHVFPFDPQDRTSPWLGLVDEARDRPVLMVRFKRLCNRTSVATSHSRAGLESAQGTTGCLSMRQDRLLLPGNILWKDRKRCGSY